MTCPNVLQRECMILLLLSCTPESRLTASSDFYLQTVELTIRFACAPGDSGNEMHRSPMMLTQSCLCRSWVFNGNWKPSKHSAWSLGAHTPQPGLTHTTHPPSSQSCHSVLHQQLRHCHPQALLSISLSIFIIKANTAPYIILFLITA